jgi:multiple sugar transport system permease protein
MGHLRLKPRGAQPASGRLPPALRLLIHLVLIVGAAIEIMPLLWTLSTSLKQPSRVFSVPPQLFPHPIQWSNYAEVFTQVPFARFYLNSVLVATLFTTGTLVTSSLAAYAFARLRFPGRDKIFLAYLATLMIPSQVQMIPTYLGLRFLHVLDTYFALIVPLMFSAFGTFLLRQFFVTLPKEIEDAAVIDGSSRFRTYLQIIVPLSQPAFAALGIFAFLESWNNFMWPLIVITKTRLMTIPLGLAMFIQPERVLWNLMMAAVMVSIIPMVIVFLIGQRQFIQGITLSGLKA